MCDNYLLICFLPFFKGARRRFTGRRSTAAGAAPTSVSRTYQPSTSTEPYVKPSMREALMVGVIEPYLGSFRDSMQIKPYGTNKNNLIFFFPWEGKSS